MVILVDNGWLFLSPKKLIMKFNSSSYVWFISREESSMEESDKSARGSGGKLGFERSSVTVELVGVVVGVV